MILEEAILEKVRTLPLDKQQQVLDFVEFLQSKSSELTVTTATIQAETPMFPSRHLSLSSKSGLFKKRSSFINSSSSFTIRIAFNSRCRDSQFSIEVFTQH
jgi:hypothetical protein